MPRRWVLLMCGILFGGIAAKPLAAEGGQASAGEEITDVAAMTNLVVQDCGSCHGLKLTGGLGRPITAEHMQAFDRQTLRSIVLDGIPGTAMPGWRGLISEAEADWIAKNLKAGTFE